MKSTARKLDFEEISQELGRVLRVEGSAIKVRCATGEHDARRAVSCLVEPVGDDQVIVAHTPNGAAYVLAVLERAPGAKATVRVDGDLELCLANGRFAVAAQDGIGLVSGKDVSVTAGELKVNAVEGSVVLQQLSFLGGFVRAEMEKVKLLAGTFDAVMERLSQKVKRSYRTVENDQLRAERIDYTAKSTMSLHAENALVTAEELVKIDGEQIHLG